MPPLAGALALDISGMVSSSTRTARALFYERLARLPEEAFMGAVMVADSDAASHDYGWLGDVPAAREWTDERTLSELTAHSYQIINKRWEATVKVPLMAFRSNNLNLIRSRTLDLADEGVRHVFDSMSALLVAGTSALCFTGKAFFADDHEYASSGAFDNLLAGTGSTLDKIKADWATARAKARRYPNSRGKAINAVPDLAWVPPELEGVFKEFFKATQLAGTSNVYVGEGTVVVDPNLADTNDWYALCTNRGIKPLVWQSNIAWRFSAVDNLADSYVFLNDEVLYGGDGYYNAGYGLPQFAQKVVNT